MRLFDFWMEMESEYDINHVFYDVFGGLLENCSIIINCNNEAARRRQLEQATQSQATIRYNVKTNIGSITGAFPAKRIPSLADALPSSKVFKTCLTACHN